MRPLLLIVRAGDRSLHPHWLKGAAERKWDLHVSYFGKSPDAFADRPADVALTHDPGMKLPGVADCLDKLGDRIAGYRWIGLPDDDLLADCNAWNRLVEVLEELEPVLAQPALHPRSFYSHQITLQRRGLKARWTDFVEMMTPVLDQDLLARMRPRFRDNNSGWGLDYMWSSLAGDRACIVDAAPVLHTRKIQSGGLHKAMAGTGVTPREEQERFGFAAHEPRTHRAVTLAGRIITDEARLNRRQRTPTWLKRWRKWRNVTDLV